MSVIAKVRGLWRFDGDEEPVAVSRRSFILLSGVVLAGAALPASKIIGTVVGTTVDVDLALYEAASGTPVLVVSAIDHVRGIITFDTLSALDVYPHPGREKRFPFPVVIEDRGKTFDELQVGSAVSKRDVMLADLRDQMSHPNGERWLTQSPHYAIVTSPERIGDWERRLRGKDRPGGRMR